jgi:hypothetical protein
MGNDQLLSLFTLSAPVTLCYDLYFYPLCVLRRLLKTGSTEKLSDTEIEEYLEKTVQLFSYLTDQDLFAEIYRNQ